MRRYWKTVALVAVVVAVALSVVAVAYGTTRSTAKGRAGGNGACGTLMSNPEALKAMQALRADHQKDMRAWYDEYGSDPASVDAQAALQRLREEHRSDMRQLFDKLGVKAPAGHWTWRRAGWRRRLCWFVWWLWGDRHERRRQRLRRRNDEWRDVLIPA